MDSNATPCTLPDTTSHSTAEVETVKRLSRLVVALAMASALASSSVLATATPALAACGWGPNVTTTKSQSQNSGQYRWTSTVVYRVFSCNGVPAQVYVVSMKFKVTVTDGSEWQDLALMAFDSNNNWPYPPTHRYWSRTPNEGCSPYPTGNCSFTVSRAVGVAASYSTAVVAHYAGRIGFLCERMVYHKFLAGQISSFCI